MAAVKYSAVMRRREMSEKKLVSELQSDVNMN